MTKKLKIGLIVSGVTVAVLSLGIGLGLGLPTSSNDSSSMVPTSPTSPTENVDTPLLKTSHLETVWSGPGGKIQPTNTRLTNEHVISTTSSRITSFDVISTKNTQIIPANANRKVISEEATTLSKEFAKNNKLYVYFSFPVSGELASAEGTFPATYSNASKTSDEKTITNFEISLRVSKDVNSQSTYDTLENYTINFNYQYLFRTDPQGSGNQILTLAIKDFEIIFAGSPIVQKPSSIEARTLDGHQTDTSLFKASSVIGTGF